MSEQQADYAASESATTKPLTDARLEQIRCDSAEMDGYTLRREDHGYILLGTCAGVDGYIVGHIHGLGDGKAICRAASDIDDLLAEIDRLRAEVGRWRVEAAVLRADCEAGRPPSVFLCQGRVL